MPPTIKRADPAPPLAPPSEDALVAIKQALEGSSPDRLLAVAEGSLARTRSALSAYGPRADSKLIANNLTWAYVALQRLLFATPSLRPGPDAAGTPGKRDIMQATRDIARGA